MPSRSSRHARWRRYKLASIGELHDEALHRVHVRIFRPSAETRNLIALLKRFLRPPVAPQQIQRLGFERPAMHAARVRDIEIDIRVRICPDELEDRSAHRRIVRHVERSCRMMREESYGTGENCKENLH